MVTSLMVKSSENDLFRLSISDIRAAFVGGNGPYTTLRHAWFCLQSTP